MPCHVGDIWGENGISMFALTGYWIGSDWKFHEVLLHCAPFSKDAHTGDAIKKLTLDILVSILCNIPMYNSAA
jgi:hypothetical protein